MKNVLVTGATGFVGGHLVEKLLAAGHAVTATSTRAENAERFKWFDEIRYIPLDFRSIDPSIDYYTYFGQPDVMIHLAWEGLPNYRSDFHVTENLPRHRALLQNLIQHGLKSLVVTGTCLEYGMRDGSLNEDMPAQPSVLYAMAKDELRKSLETLMRHAPFSLKWIRLFYLYGKGQNPNSLFSQLDRALERGDASFNMSGGEQQRDYLPIETAAGYIVKIAQQERVTGIVNCCSGVPVRIKDFVRDYLSRTGSEIQLNLGHYPYTDYEPMSFWGDPGKLNTILKNE
jgi:nucleoside-diphosphate-sugar epimerase